MEGGKANSDWGMAAFPLIFKLMRTLVLVNVLNSVNSYIYTNHIEFWSKTKELYPKSHNNEFFLFTPPRMSVDMARNTAAKQAMMLECDNLMFIDDDVLIPPTSFDSLLKCNADIASGLVIIRGYPFNVMAFRREGQNLPYFNDLPTAEIEVESGLTRKVLRDPVTQDDGLIAVGFSCALTKIGILKKIPQPYFVTGPRNTEDIYFCLKAKDSIPELKISLATHVQCGHLLYPEPIEYATIDIFREFYETLRPETAESIKNEEKGRDAEYIKSHLKRLE